VPRTSDPGVRQGGATHGGRNPNVRSISGPPERTWNHCAPVRRDEG
jgi:hypothetical protein